MGDWKSENAIANGCILSKIILLLLYIALSDKSSIEKSATWSDRSVVKSRTGTGIAVKINKNSYLIYL
jgi:hypothetical protein